MRQRPRGDDAIDLGPGDAGAVMARSAAMTARSITDSVPTTWRDSMPVASFAQPAGLSANPVDPIRRQERRRHIAAGPGKHQGIEGTRRQCGWPRTRFQIAGRQVE